MVWVRPLEINDLDLVAGWLALEENYQWLDFGSGLQQLSPVSLAAMVKRDIHDILVFGEDGKTVPVGLVALSDIATNFGSGTLWYVLGDKSYGGKGYTSQAVAAMLERAFGTLGLVSVYAWTVSNNIGSARILEKHGFQRIGVQRQCHRIGETQYDRLSFDLLAEEYTTNLGEKPAAKFLHRPNGAEARANMEKDVLKYEDSMPDMEVTGKITTMLRDRLNVVVPSVDTDLIGEGILDSLALVDLIMYLEMEFGFTVALDQLELGNFQTVGRIAEMVEKATAEMPSALVS